MTSTNTIILVCYLVVITSGLLLLWKVLQPLNTTQQKAWTTEFPQLNVVMRDPIVISILILTFAFCLHGIQWGRYESWNPDQMALKGTNLFLETKFRPSHYLKPPFHSYLNFFLTYVPVKIIQKLSGMSPTLTHTMLLVWSRVLTASMLLGSIIFAYRLVFAFFGRHTARAVSALFGTSAGFVAFSHFLTADIPVMFWMMCALFWSTRAMVDPQYRNYILAGVFTGLATATKYNGLAVGISIPVAHLLNSLSVRTPWRSAVFDSKPLVGVFAVPIGFLMGCPWAIADYSRFQSDFYYNYLITPVYGGITTGNSYITFWHSVIEVFGAPLFCIMVLSIGLLLVGQIRKRDLRYSELAFLCLMLSVFLLYYGKLAAFPRWETRFALPVLPVLLMSTSAFWARLRSKTRLLVCVPLLIYGGLCSMAVGARFLDDPRMKAEIWMARNVPITSSIESTSYVPDWRLLGYERAYRMPSVSGRARVLAKALAGDQSALSELKHSESDNVGWFTRDALHIRSPDFIAVDSLYYDRFYGDNAYAKAYPELKVYFDLLLAGRFDYCIVFDRRSPSYARWMYPEEIDFLDNRLVILKRKRSPIDNCIERIAKPALPLTAQGTRG